MIHLMNIKRFVCMCVALFHVIASTLLVVGPAHAQSGADNEAPVVDLQLVETGRAGDTQVFTATVTDNIEVVEVVLYYRVKDAGDFDSVPMQPIPGTSIYSVSVEFEGSDSITVEYYINAADSNNNRVVRGYAFDPLVRELAADPQIAAAPVVTTVVAVAVGAAQRSL